MAIGRSPRVTDVVRRPKEQIRRRAEIVLLFLSHEEQHGARPVEVAPAGGGADGGGRLGFPVEQLGLIG